MITDKQIKDVIIRLAGDKNPTSEDYDQVRISYQWLDAQKKTKTMRKHNLPLKHLIERWGGHYVSNFDVMVAVSIHREIKGFYDSLNISSRLTLPSENRLRGIKIARTQQNYDASCDINDGYYKYFEE